MAMRLHPLFLVPAMCLFLTSLQARIWTSADGTQKIINTLVKNLPVDKERIYITGYSMGGFGTFDIVAREPKLFAAAVPVSGGGNPATAASMKRVPFWVFHGDADTVVNVEQSRKMVEALKKAGGKADYTEIPGAGHGIIGQVYQDQKLHEWMFDQTKGKKAAK